MKITKRSPTRVDLAGGTLDCWPLYLLVDGSVTVNLSISISTEVILESRDDARVVIVMRDQDYRREFTDLADLLGNTDPKLNLIQKHVRYWAPPGGFTLTTHSESPIGGGLGGSSSLSISLIGAFAEWLKVDLTTLQAVTLAGNLEAQVLGKMTGTQDYFPAVRAGLNAIHYGPRGPELERLVIKPDFFDQRLSLVYTGQPHHSGLNNWQVIKAALDGDRPTLNALGDIRDVALDLYRDVKADRWENLPALFEREFEARVRLASSFSSPAIDRLREVALAAGARAVKILGAGGGGCVLVWSSPDRKAEVEAKCRADGFQVLNAKAVV